MAAIETLSPGILAGSFAPWPEGADALLQIHGRTGKMAGKPEEDSHRSITVKRRWRCKPRHLRGHFARRLLLSLSWPSYS
jgi:hypothetical protein